VPGLFGNFSPSGGPAAKKGKNVGKSDEIVASAGDFGAKSSSIINNTIRIFPFQGIIKNIKKL
jgi:hypothetical protein